MAVNLEFNKKGQDATPIRNTCQYIKTGHAVIQIIQKVEEYVQQDMWVHLLFEMELIW